MFGLSLANSKLDATVGITQMYRSRHKHLILDATIRVS
jgi:hypothetical protein